MTVWSNQFGATLDVLERKAWPGTSHADSVHVHYLGTRVGHQGKGSGRALLQVAKTIADDKQAACAIEATLPVVRSAVLLYRKANLLIGSNAFMLECESPRSHRHCLSALND